MTKVFPNGNFDCKKNYILPRVVTINSFQRNFQCKILDNIYLNKMLFTFRKTKTPLCSICHSSKKLFCIYFQNVYVWNNCGRLFLTNNISLPILTLQTAISNGIENNVYKITNHILLIFKLHVYKSRESGTLELCRLISEIKKVKLLEKNSAQNPVRKPEQHNTKWEKIHRTIKIWYSIDILKSLIYTEKMFCCV